MRKIRFQRLKNVVILGLVVLAFYQTGKLWLGNEPGHNFFSSLISFDAVIPDHQAVRLAPLDPEQLVVGFGNNIFQVFYCGREETALKKAGDSFIAETLSDGSWRLLSGQEAEAILSRRCLLYRFCIDVSVSQYLEAAAPEAEGIDGLEFISYLAAAPSGEDGQAGMLYLVDEGTQTAALVYDSQSSTGKALWDAIGQARSAEALNFLSTVQSGLNIFQGNLFVPQWSGEEYTYHCLQQQNLLPTGEGLASALQEAASGFFASSETPVFSVDETGVYVLSGDEAIVRYQTNGVLEYYGYGRTSSGQSQNLSSAYRACLDFMERDKTLGDQVYLSDVAMRGESLIFCFDAYEGSLPILLGDEVQQKLGIGHAVEVVVEENQVTRYRRRMVSYTPGQEDQVTEDFVAAMNETISAAGQAVTAIDDICLGYYDSGEEELTLHWFTWAGGTRYQVGTA